MRLNSRAAATAEIVFPRMARRKILGRVTHLAAILKIIMPHALSSDAKGPCGARYASKTRSRSHA